MAGIEVTLIDSMGTDLTVVNAAKVSFNKKAEEFIPGEGKGSHERLIQFLAKHKHTSPFGHCFASFHIKAPVFVARQLVKHKFLRWNEVSRRYVDDEPEFYQPDVWRCRAEDKKQGSQGVHEMVAEDRVTFDGEPYEVDMLHWKFLAEGDLLNLYKTMIDAGVAPEQARMILPQSMMTEWYWSGSLDAFSDMCNLRCYPDAQAETKEVADQIDKIMGELYPVSWKALRNA